MFELMFLMQGGAIFTLSEIILSEKPNKRYNVLNDFYVQLQL